MNERVQRSVLGKVVLIASSKAVIFTASFETNAVVIFLTDKTTKSPLSLLSPFTVTVRYLRLSAVLEFLCQEND